MKLKKYIGALLAVVLLVAADQVTKWLAVTHLMGKDPIVLWEGVFELSYLENRGAAFGIFQNQQIVFFILTLVIGVGLLWFYSRVPKDRHYFWLRLPVVVCFAGAIGNFIDRVFQGYVVDFFYFKLIDFPIFNVADIYITCSTILFVILFLFKYRDEDFQFLSRKKADAQKEASDEEEHGAESSHDCDDAHNEEDAHDGKEA